MSQVLSIYYIDGGNIMVRNLSGERSVLGVQKDSYWAVYAESTGWQLYAGPEPYAAGGWVEIRHAMRTKQAKILILDDANGTVRVMNMDGSEQWNYKADITRKLDPSEVKVTLTLEGTVSRDYNETLDSFILNHTDGHTRNRIKYSTIDPATCTLVKNLLKAQIKEDA